MDYAPEYTKREKVKLIALFMGLGAIFIAAGELWLFPSITRLAEQPHCYSLFGLNGADYLWHLLLIGMPISIFLILAVTMLPMAIKGLIQAQFPPKGYKVFKPTPIRKGMSGQLMAGLLMFVIFSPLLIAIYGANNLDKMPEVETPQDSSELCFNTPNETSTNH
ncbi:hypothetical protein ACMXYX_10835 [Neptuniibacter sp. QD72_48]|uniref:hypothetical protein n=1 Tax=Neptuniibacter sp. QD72_48 TaxID=3398214 RepID=UPI0039F56999